MILKIASPDESIGAGLQSASVFSHRAVGCGFVADESGDHFGPVLHRIGIWHGCAWDGLPDI